MYIGLHVKYPLLLSNLNETSIFSKKKKKNSNIKFYEPVGAEFVRADRRTDMTKLVVAFSQLCERA
jgi:hypothetical protein